MARILVVDDEPAVRDVVAGALRPEGFTVAVLGDPRQAAPAVRQEPPDLVILDVMMPEMDGLAVCREIRTFSRVPVLFLTARNEPIDRVLGLELGADDYLGKPFHPRELVARVKALLRRAREATQPDVVRVGDLVLNVAERTVTRAGSTLDLTAKEFELLVYMARHPGRVFTREQLMDAVWGYTYAGSGRNIDVLVKRVRRKIEDTPDEPRILVTAWGAGYKVMP